MTNRIRAFIGAALAAGLATSIAAAPAASADPLRDFQTSVANATAGIQIPHFELPQIDTSSLNGIVPPANPGSIPPGLPGGPGGPGAYVPTEQHRIAIQNELVARINDHRAANGVRRVPRDAAIDNAARWWADQLANHGRDGHSPRNTRAYPYGGENVWFGNNAPWQQVAFGAFNSWHHSPGHNKNMLNPNTISLGVGVAWSHQDQRWIAVQQYRL